MTCKNVLAQYFALDKQQPVPFRISFHLLYCSSCRRVIRAMTKTESLQVRICKDALNKSDVSRSMMKKIEALPSHMHPAYLASLRERPVHLWPWIFVGLFMIFGFCIIPLTPIGRWGLQLGSLFIVPLALMYAVAITVFSGLFVIKNIDFFIKKFDYTGKDALLFSVDN